MKKIVIAGGSAAGVNAAKSAKKTDPGCEVTLISKEQYPPYYRPYLTEYIGDRSVENRPNFYINSSEWYKENNINLLLSTEVTKIVPDENKIIDSKGNNYLYDSLILANGSSPFVPVSSFLEEDFVFALRSFDDAKKVDEFASNTKKATIIGGGLLGLEAAWSLCRRNIEVTVIELADRLLPVQLDSEASNLIGSLISRHNVNILTSAMTDHIATGEDGKKYVFLKDGRQIETDMVIMSIGVRANTGLAKECSIKTDRGIVVDSKMRTSVKNIFACGDVAQFDCMIPLWMPAVKQGIVAGTNAAGGDIEFTSDVYPAMFNAFEIKLFSIGDISKQQKENEYSKSDGTVYRKLFFKNDRLSGAILINDPAKSSTLINGVKKAVCKEDAVKMI